MHTLKIWSICLLFIAGIAHAQNSTSTGSTGISTTGSAVSYVVPDRAYIRMGIQLKGNTAMDVNENLESIVKRIRLVLQKYKVSDNDFQLEQPNYSVVSEYSDAGMQPQRMTLLMQYFTIGTSQVNQVGALIGELINVGAQQVAQVKFTSTKTEQTIASTKEQAFKTAKADAEKLATLAGVSLGKLVEIAEPQVTEVSLYEHTQRNLIGAPGEGPMYETFPVEGFGLNLYPAGAALLEPGKIMISVKLSVRFAIQ